MKRNESIGRVPYGYRKAGKSIEPDEDTGSVVRTIFDLARQYASENGSRGAASAIAASLNANGISSPNGGEWEVTTVKRILKQCSDCLDGMIYIIRKNRTTCGNRVEELKKRLAANTK